MPRRFSVLRALLLAGMALLIPCFLFTAANTLFSPWPLYHRSRAALLVLTPLCLAALLVLLPRLAGPLARRMEKDDRPVLLAFALGFFALQTVLSMAFRHVPITDAEQCFTAASLLADTGAFETSERAYIYFSRYPFNLGFVYLLSGLFRLCALAGWQDRFLQTVWLSALLFSAGLAASARYVRRRGGCRAEARLLLLFPCTLPFLYCTAELYTDVFALAFPPVILLCFDHVMEEESLPRRILWGLAFALAAFAGMQIRVTAAIAVIACFLQALFERRGRALLTAGILILAVLLPGNAAVERLHARHLGAENLRTHRLSVWHYLAMGLPIHEDEGYGQYGDGGWLLFSTSFEDPEARDAALKTEVRDRIYYLRYPSRMLNMLSRKNLSTFGDGTFRLHEIIEGDEHASDNPAKQIVYGQGSLHGAYQHLCTAIFIAQLLLCCLSCVQSLRRRDTRSAALYLTLLGAFLYLCMWETKARYFFMFQMALLAACALLDLNPSKPNQKRNR